MFIIPIGNRVNWKRPPIVTLLLIVINCLVFILLQGKDEQKELEAAKYYLSSDLPDWEFERYTEYLEKQGNLAKTQKFNELLKQQPTYALMFMEADHQFIKDLHAGNIIVTQAPVFSDWVAQRQKYEEMRSFTSRYAFQVDDPKLINLTIAAFMHGGFGHLIGNMVMLFLIGFLVESVIGKRLFALGYLVAIYVSGWMFSLTSTSGAMVGASGAIAGVMGLYTVIFGLRKIDFFYSVVIYFDYVRAPAIILLPLWMGNELYQFLSEDESHVAYMAHFGGLLAGAIMGVFYRWWQPTRIENHHKEAETKETDDQTFQRGMEYLRTMDYKKALVLFKELLAKHPQDAHLMELIYRASKSQPASDDYHQAALQILNQSAMDRESSEKIHIIFEEYMHSAKPSPKISFELAAKLAKRFAGANHCGTAENLLRYLKNNAPKHPALPDVLLALGQGFYREQRKDRFVETLQELIKQYPESIAAKSAADMLRVAS